MKIGDIVWVKEQYGAGYYRRLVAGETSRSWLMLPPEAPGWQRQNLSRFAAKLPKNGKGWVVGTEADAKLDEWAQTHRWRIGSLIQAERNGHLLLKIAKMLDYKDLPEDAVTPVTGK